MPSDASSPPAGRPRPLRELAALYLRLGLTAFGGPAAHIAMMEDEVVVRRKWLSREEFVDLLGATNLIPGPNSTEMAIHVGHRRAGFAGLLLAGTCFILPAAVLVLAIAWAYVHFGTLPQVAGILYGVKPVVVVIVLQALWRLSRTALKDKVSIAVALLATVSGFLGIHELLILFGAGVATPLIRDLLNRKRRRSPPALLLGLVPIGPATTTAVTLGAAVPFGLWPLFLFFLKVGAVLFGSGYVLLAFLRADLVERWHWLTESQLLDAVAVGQITPGPVFTTATFIGYVLGGPTGAVVATVGIFLPAFFFVAISGPLVSRLRRSAVAGAVLDGVNAGSLALMAVVTWHLGRVAVRDVPTVALAVVTAVLLWRWRLNSAWLILGAAVVGLVLAQFA
jgi:chromate transporter